MQIEQYVISESITFFEKNFRDLYKDLKIYHDINKPLFFFGFNNMYNIFETHNSYKIIWSADPFDLPDFKKIKNSENTILLIDNELPDEYFIPDSVLVRKMVLPIKDYSMFKPNKMGDKIYYYSGSLNGWSPNPKDIIYEIQREINFEIISTIQYNREFKYMKYDINYIKSQYYDKCFVNLNFSDYYGMTTVRELSFMGRKTICSIDNPYDYKCLIKCKDMESIIKSILEESKKINTIQSEIDVHTVSNEWLNIDYLVNGNY